MTAIACSVLPCSKPHVQKTWVQCHWLCASAAHQLWIDDVHVCLRCSACHACRLFTYKSHLIGNESTATVAQRKGHASALERHQRLLQAPRQAGKEAAVVWRANGCLRREEPDASQLAVLLCTTERRLPGQDCQQCDVTTSPFNRSLWQLWSFDFRSCLLPSAAA